MRDFQPEEETAAIADRCLQRTILRTAGGAAAGSLLGMLLLRKGHGGRKMLTWLSTGAGLGSAYTECQLDFRQSEQQGKRFPKLKEALMK
mmetsp:Transcript_25548/g.84432  ORF Transcript_25548/g.84432 Transcript_25548/m.84432 type:complete len:90 (+) Transcript_25548:186-455(+)